MSASTAHLGPSVCSGWGTGGHPLPLHNGMGAQLGAGKDDDRAATAPQDMGEMSLREWHSPCFGVMKFAAGTACLLTAQEKHPSQPAWHSTDLPPQRQCGCGSALLSRHAAFGKECWTHSMPVCWLSEAALPAVGLPMARRAEGSSLPPCWHRGCGVGTTGCVTSAGGVLAGFGGETAPNQRLQAQTRLLSSVTDVLATSGAQLKA